MLGMKRATNNLTPRHGLPTTAGAATIPRLSRSPATPHAFAWKLTEPIDRFANAIRYECGVDGGERDRHRWQQQMLTRAVYMDDGDLAVSSFLVPVGFHDEDRPDAFRTIARDWTSGRAPVRSHPSRNLSIGRHHASAARISACYVDSTIPRAGLCGRGPAGHPSSAEQLLRRIAISDCGGSLPISSGCQSTGVDQLTGIVHGRFQQSLESLRRLVEDNIPWDAS